MGNFFKKFGPLLLTIGGTVITAVSPTVQHAVAGHVGATAGLVIASNVLHALLPSIFAGQSQQ